MDLLKAALNTKRQSLENKELVGPEKKYFKREELIKKEEEEYWEKSSEKLRASINNENQFTNKGLGLSSNLGNSYFMCSKDLILIMLLLQIMWMICCQEKR